MSTQGPEGPLNLETTPAPQLRQAAPVARRASTRYQPYYAVVGSPADPKNAVLLDALFERTYDNITPGKTHFYYKYWGDASNPGNNSGFVDEAVEYMKQVKVYLASPPTPEFLSIKNRLESSTAPLGELESFILYLINFITDTDSNGVVTFKNTAFRDIFANVATFEGQDESDIEELKAYNGLIKYADLKTITDAQGFDLEADLNDFVGLSTMPTNTPFATFMPSKFALTKFLEARDEYARQKQQRATAPPAPTPSEPTNIFFRKVGVTDKLYTLDSDGNDVEVQAGSASFQSLTEAASCYGTGLDDSNETKKCSDYVTKCLAGGEVKACRDYMATPGYWANAESSVRSMNPEFMMATLDSFGFKPVHTETASGQAYKAYPPTTEWIKTLKDQLSDDPNAQKVVDDVSTNIALMGYLDAIVTRVNASPGILNPTFVEGKPAINTNAFADSLLSQYGIKPKAIANTKLVAKPVKRSDVTAVENTVVTYMTGLGQVFGIAPTIGPMMGGGDWDIEVSKDSTLPIKVSDTLNEMYNSVVENLQQGGKDLDKSDQQTIKNMVNELNVLENKLFKAVNYSNGFESLLSINQKAGGVINENSYNKFVVKRNDYFNRVQEKYNKIFPIFNKLAEACSKETISENDVITTKNFPKYD